ncbi:hypothetical protein QQP08_005845 [Theobroma cacao]|nr:hypothetical protein QQP08_005845 [Theobroma cacao]
MPSHVMKQNLPQLKPTQTIKKSHGTNDCELCQRLWHPQRPLEYHIATRDQLIFIQIIDKSSSNTGNRSPVSILSNRGPEDTGMEVKYKIQFTIKTIVATLTCGSRRRHPSISKYVFPYISRNSFITKVSSRQLVLLSSSTSFHPALSCGNNMARFIEGFASSLCFLKITSGGIDVRIASNFGTSSSATNTPISSQGIASAKGKTISSAMMTGMQPNTTASTSLGLQGAHPRGHKQNIARCMSS